MNDIDDDIELIQPYKYGDRPFRFIFGFSRGRWLKVEPLIRDLSIGSGEDFPSPPGKDEQHTLMFSFEEINHSALVVLLEVSQAASDVWSDNPELNILLQNISIKYNDPNVPLWDTVKFQWANLKKIWQERDSIKPSRWRRLVNWWKRKCTQKSS